MTRVVDAASFGLTGAASTWERLAVERQNQSRRVQRVLVGASLLVPGCFNPSDPGDVETTTTDSDPSSGTGDGGPTTSSDEEESTDTASATENDATATE